MRAEAELGVWRRLLDDAALGMTYWTVLFVDLSSDQVRELVPRSRWESTVLSAPSSVWSDVIQPDAPSCSFAMACSGGVADPLMVGLPTEEAWDAFRLAVSSRAGR